MRKFITSYAFQEQVVKRAKWSVPEDSDENCVLVERSGYIPLSARLKQFSIAGMQMSLQRKQFDFEDYKELYHDFEILSPNDDIETTQEKLDEFYYKQNEIRLKQLEKFKNSSITSERKPGVSDQVTESSEDSKV